MDPDKKWRLAGRWGMLAISSGLTDVERRIVESRLGLAKAARRP